MDWFSWLSKSNLDTSLVYKYAVEFAHNELQLNDLTHFNHEFLQSMGISVAKHRLEILKLAKKEKHEAPQKHFGLALAFNKTRRVITKCITKLVFHEESEKKVKYKTMGVSGPLDGNVIERLVVSSKNLRFSGPLDGKKIMERVRIDNSRRLMLSGPLDGRGMPTNKGGRLSGNMERMVMVRGRLMGPPGKRMNASGPLDLRVASKHVCSRCDKEKVEFVGGDDGDDDGDDYRLPWSSMFQDMKPT